ncbi:MAG: sigma-70 family RNA polymerase sigma factor [Armatimonadetes bacterium]|nr:sigma-70 family RNA polymerase sigma factor [Armatimonadota bacterium]
MPPESGNFLSPKRFEELYKEFWPYVYAVCRAALGDPDEAQDAAQEVFLRKWRKRDAYNAATGSFKSWLSVNALRVCVDRLRRKDLERRAAEYAATDSPHRAEGMLKTALVETCLSRLSPEERLCLVMRDVLEFTWEELAAATGRSVAAVRRLVAAARRHLGDCLGE